MNGRISKFISISSFICVISNNAFAQNWDLSQSGLAGLYYGLMQSRDKNNTDCLPNRLVFRADGKAEAVYLTTPQNRYGIHADYTIVYRQHYSDYSEGDWRFYPYLLADTPNYGRLTIGYNHSAAYQLHQGAGKISWIGLQDSNLTYYLSGANWSNGQKKVKFATPKSTNIMADGRAPKIVYFSPEIANTKFGFSYSPSTAHRRGMVSRYADYQTTEDGYTTGIKNKWSLPLGTLTTSLTHGAFHRTDKEWAFGARWNLNKFYLSSSYKNAYIDGQRNPITTESINNNLPAYFDNYREAQAWDFSIGYDFGRFQTQLAYLHTQAQNSRHRDDLIVQENRFLINKYLEFYLINGYINSKGDKRVSDNNNKGYSIISGLAVRY